jgi:molybdate transport system permease protein
MHVSACHVVCTKRNHDETSGRALPNPHVGIVGTHMTPTVRMLPDNVGMSRPADLRGAPRLLLLTATALLLALFTLPLLAIVLRGAPVFFEALGAPGIDQAIGLTLATSLSAVAVIVLLGLPAAWLIARRQTRSWKLIDALLDLPVVLPPSVAGIGLLIAFGRNGLLGPLLNNLGVQVAFTTAAVIIAQVFVAAPLFVRAAVIGLRRIDEDMEAVAMVDGASAAQVFRFVTLPLAAPALLTGAVLAWARALGEFGATILFAGNLVGRTQTMALAIYVEFQSNPQAALALALLLIVLTLLVLFTVRVLAQWEN